MNEKQETFTITKDKKSAMERMLALINPYPQIFQSVTSIETLVDEFIKAFTKYSKYSDQQIFALEALSNTIVGYQQAVQSGIGGEAFLESLSKAAAKYDEYFAKFLTA